MSFAAHFHSAPAAVSGARTNGLRLAVRLVRTRQAFEAIAPEWAALEAGSRNAVLFQSVGWCRAVFEFAAGRVDFDPVIVTLRRDGELKGVLPLERVHAQGCTLLAALGNGFQQYSDVLLAPDVDPAEAVREMLAVAVREARCDVVSLLKVRADSALAQGLPPGHVATGASAGAPYVALANFKDFADYHATVKAKTRKNMRNARNRLERSGPVEHEVAASPIETLGVIGRTVVGRAQRLEDQGLTSRAFQDEHFLDFCLSLVNSDLDLLAMSLTHNGVPIAEQWGFVHGGRYYAFVASRDFTIGEESPGKLHLKNVIETGFDRGLSTVDLLVPTMAYKLTWASGVTEVQDHAVPVSLKGHARVHLWDRLLRPLAKKAYLAMPQGVRTRLMAVLRPGRGHEG
jgi:CelD/BcsL family acetyltransferase involved in cellulose biosynthesis